MVESDMSDADMVETDMFEADAFENSAPENSGTKTRKERSSPLCIVTFQFESIFFNIAKTTTWIVPTKISKSINDLEMLFFTVGSIMKNII